MRQKIMQPLKDVRRTERTGWIEARERQKERSQGVKETNQICRPDCEADRDPAAREKRVMRHAKRIARRMGSMIRSGQAMGQALKTRLSEAAKARGGKAALAPSESSERAI